MDYKIGDIVLFDAFSELVGRHTCEGIIEGDAKYAKKIWGDEIGAMNNDDKIFVVKTKDKYFNIHRYLVFVDEIREKLDEFSTPTNF